MAPCITNCDTRETEDCKIAAKLLTNYKKLHPLNMYGTFYYKL